MILSADPPALLSRIEDAGLNASAPPQQRWLDGWLLRYSPGKAQRARCINALAEGVLPRAERLALCQDFYRERGLPLLVRLTPFSRPGNLDDWLAQRGFERFDDTRVMLCPQLPRSSIPAKPADVQIEKVPPEVYAHTIGELRGTPDSGRQAHAQRLSSAAVPLHGSVLRRADGQLLACGQFALEGALVGLYDVHTAPHARGQGLASWLCAHLLDLARQQGARCAYLQVDAQNHAARAVYRRLGFQDAYGYHYRAAAHATGA